VKFSELKQQKWFRYMSSIYTVILILFLVWMLFFDTNSWFIHQELNDDIDALKDNKGFYIEEIKKDNTFIEKMKDSLEQEKFAREKYYLKKENEDIFIIEHEDSLKLDEKYE
jgi:cell division protein DivIC